MKSITFAAVFSSVLVFVLGQLDSELEEIHKKVLKSEEEAAKYCNELIPVSEDTRVKLEREVIRGESVPKDFHTSEWCNLNCNLEKLKFFEADGSMHLREIYESLLRKMPEFHQNRYKLLIHLFQTYRATKGMVDECERAYVAYYRFAEAIMIATVVADMNENQDIKDVIVEKLLTGDDFPKELEVSAEKAFKNTEFFFELNVLDTIGTSGARVEL
ncbi:uncharacterized protein LOC135843729 [Planococcus citri]|uniref:uncharacterized protein LOC135843729 n=1 Tax=Planococcus citri TaxID=170843 RepID=UPI0031F8D48E